MGKSGKNLGLCPFYVLILIVGQIFDACHISTMPISALCFKATPNDKA
jgi:hypothetical protein